MKKISIFTPTHNTKYLSDAYVSIKDQDFYEWIVILNNGAQPIDFHDDRVHTIEAPMQTDWVGALKAYACSKASGDVLLELDHDDMLIPGALEEVQEAFKNEEVGFVYSNTLHFQGNFEKVPRYSEQYGWRYREVAITVNDNKHLIDEHLHFEPTPNCISRIWFAPNHLRAFTRKAYDAVGGYNQKMRVLDDLDLMCRLYLVTKFYHIDKGLYLYREHENNTYKRADLNPEIQNNVYRVHDMYIEAMAEKWASDNKLRKVELGGRMGAKPGYETVDLKEAAIIHDLETRWPFENGSVGVIRAYDVFEHLKNPIHTMKELYRVLAPGGYAFIQVPSTDGRGAFQDPTHVSFWNENSFKYYTSETHNKYIDCPVRFQSIRLLTTDMNKDKICWVKAHLLKLGEERVPGEKFI